MKTVLLGAMLIATPAPSADPDLWWTAGHQAAQHFIDSASIAPTPQGTRTARTLMINNPDHPVESGAAAEAIMLEFDCAGRRTRILKTAAFAADGSILGAFEHDSEPMLPAQPESVGAANLDFVCAAGPEQRGVTAVHLPADRQPGEFARAMWASSPKQP